MRSNERLKMQGHSPEHEDVVRESPRERGARIDQPIESRSTESAGRGRAARANFDQEHRSRPVGRGAEMARDRGERESAEGLVARLEYLSEHLGRLTQKRAASLVRAAT
jgi:hypothetical protein